jgi:nitroimidazol reductase NimA-like FMN-containing flavoprotein (pyridoxamine 5'-phosphate oxidase superfamily)
MDATGATETTLDPYTGTLILSLDDCWQLLRDHEVGRLAVSIANHPDIFPINYVVDDS